MWLGHLSEEPFHPLPPVDDVPGALGLSHLPGKRAKLMRSLICILSLTLTLSAPHAQNYVLELDGDGDFEDYGYGSGDLNPGVS